MKVRQEPQKFNPVILELESEVEVEWLRIALQLGAERSDVVMVKKTANEAADKLGDFLL